MSDRAHKQGQSGIHKAHQEAPPDSQNAEVSEAQSSSPELAGAALGGGLPLDPKSVLRLQSLIGNQTVQQVLQQSKVSDSDPPDPTPSSLPTLQPTSSTEPEFDWSIRQPDSLSPTRALPASPGNPALAVTPTVQGGLHTPHIQRDAPDAGAPATATVPPAAEGTTPGTSQLSSEATRQLLYATTTLRRVEPLKAGEQQLLEKTIPGATLLVQIQERDQKRQELKQFSDELGVIKPEHGNPEPGSALEHQIEELNRQIGILTPEIERLNRSIRAQLGALKLTNESQLIQLITEDFPRLFVERAKKIAITELEQNKELAEREKQRYSQQGGKPEDRQGLRQAAQDLFHRQTQLDQLNDQLQIAQDDVDRFMPSAGTPDPSELPSSYYDVQHLRPRLEQQRTELQQCWDRYRVQYPVLQKDVDIEKIATGDNEALDKEINSPIDKVLENIEETKKEIADGKHLKVWNLRNIVDMTAQDLGVATNPTLMQVVGQHIEQEQSDEATLKIAVGALAITAFIVATVASGGLALAAGGVALAAGGYQAYQSLGEYQAESAASNVALDPRIADISQKEPDLFWLVMDIAGVVLDAAQVVKMFNEMRVVARALKETGELGEFARVARSVLPPDVANRVIVNASRQASAAKSVGKTIKAVGAAFRHADMAEVAKHIEGIAGKGFARVIERLQADGSFHPLTEEALEAVLGNRRASRLITEERALKWMGFYDPKTGHMFIRPGSLAEMSSTVIHESVHYMQGSITGRAVKGFLVEFEAYAAQRHFLQNLARASGPEAVPDAWRWLFEASDDAIAAHISLHYGYTIPGNMDGSQAVLDVIRRIRMFR